MLLVSHKDKITWKLWGSSAVNTLWRCPCWEVRVAVSIQNGPNVFVFRNIQNCTHPLCLQKESFVKNKVSLLLDNNSDWVKQSRQISGQWWQAWTGLRWRSFRKFTGWGTFVSFTCQISLCAICAGHWTIRCCGFFLFFFQTYTGESLDLMQMGFVSLEAFVLFLQGKSIITLERTGPGKFDPRQIGVHKIKLCSVTCEFERDMLQARSLFARWTEASLWWGILLQFSWSETSEQKMWVTFFATQTAASSSRNWLPAFFRLQTHPVPKTTRQQETHADTTRKKSTSWWYWNDQENGHHWSPCDWMQQVTCVVLL